MSLYLIEEEAMATYKVQRKLRRACAAVILMAAAAFADTTPTPGNPDTNASDRNYDTNQPNSAPGAAQKAEDAGNRGMNKVDETVHKGIHKTKKSTHHAKKKSHDAMDEMTEPAKKPS
jgi:hypothetical protein